MIDNKQSKKVKNFFDICKKKNQSLFYQYIIFVTL